MTSTIASQLAAAPISWGVCEAENWGYQLPAERVLQEMKELGIRATEFGPVGFLPVDPQPRADMLR
ncbi:MAG: inosose dehydratase, partial [Actinomycetota bacterium]|nr:inosose dehydratase [Actinomycetota bacterium]